MNMSYEDRDTYGMYRSNDSAGPGPRLMGANTLIGDDVYNHKNEKLGDIKEIMLDTYSGKVCYAVLSYGGFFGIGEKLFAVPWKALTLDTENKRLVLSVEKEKIENAPGFNTDHWPNMADEVWTNEIHRYYATEHTPPV
jgi:sporulation protein YlmC with PRC-barrel domain